MERARWLENSIANEYGADGVVVLNVLDHNAYWGPPSDADCSDWRAEAGLSDTVVLREVGDIYSGEATTAASYDGDHYMLLLLDVDRRVRIRWGQFWNEGDLAPTIDDILAGR
ncbi:MAG: hypothetical protein HYY06_01880 [Deltaproteobacteria bacterium]|nr:hypothetical protein [Deltaproteobacteria bacterium]